MAQLFTPPFQQTLDANANAISGARLSFYVSGTTTPAKVYADAALTTELSAPVVADAAGRFVPIYLDPQVKYRVIVADAGGTPIRDVDPITSGIEADLADGDGLAIVGFQQTGSGAVKRTALDKLRETATPVDYGAAPEAAQNLTAFNAAASARAGGGPLDIPEGVYQVGDQPLGPSRGNIHAYDDAQIGTASIVTNPTFAGASPASWTLTGFTANAPGVTHATGSVGEVAQTVTIAPYTRYHISLDLNVTTFGGFGLRFGSELVYGDGDLCFLPVGAHSLDFTFFSRAVSGSTVFALFTDGTFAGKITSLDIIKIAREMPSDFMSIPSDQRNFKNPHSVKFGRAEQGNAVVGDREAGGVMTAASAWNVVFGARALSSCTDAQENTAIGAFALQHATSEHNTAIGYSAGKYLKTGQRFTAVGYKAAFLTATSNDLSAFGHFSLFYLKAGDGNSAFGQQSLYYLEFGGYNTAHGHQAGLNAGGNESVYIGAFTGPNTPGDVRQMFNRQTVIGTGARAYGSGVLVMGSQAVGGSDPLASGTAATGTTVIGTDAVANADETTVIGNGATVTARTSMRSTVAGTGAKSTGSNGTAVGYIAEAGQQSAALGPQAKATHTNALTLGFGSTSTADNQATIGNAGMDTFRAPTATITTISDRRDKANIQTIDANFAADVIAALKPSRWDWAMRGQFKRDGGDTGFIAQDLDDMQQAQDAAWLGLVNTANPDRFEATPGKLIPVLVAALQGALARIAALESTRSTQGE